MSRLIFVLFLLFPLSCCAVGLQQPQNRTELIAKIKYGEKQLKEGNFSDGFAKLALLNRLHNQQLKALELTADQLQSVKDKSILVECRGGISPERASLGFGDLFTFCRWIKVLEQKTGARVFFDPLSSTRSFFEKAGYRLANPNQMFDYSIPLAALPAVVDAASNLQNHGPYLSVDSTLINFDAVFNRGSGIFICICWRASNLFPFNRNVPFDQFVDFLQQLDFALKKNNQKVTFYSLIPDISEQEKHILASRAENLTFKTIKKAQLTFETCAALMRSCDATITVDTVFACLAGALFSQKTWVLLPADSDWRWGLDETAQLFPSLRLIRQKFQDAETNDWGFVLKQVKEGIVNHIAKAH